MLAAKTLLSGINPDEKETTHLALLEAHNWQFKVFSVLWAIAALFHMAHSGVYDIKLNYTLLSLAAIFVIFRPGNLLGFLLFIALQLYSVFNMMPRVSNHWIFTAFINLTILHALLYLIVKQRSFQVNQGEWLKMFAPAVRFEIIILYFYAVFQKLNSGFFSPDVSCATDLLQAQLPSFITLPPGIIAFNAYFTLLIEGAIPVLLLFKRTRHWGILFGVVFHCILSYSSYNAYYDFSSMVFAAYFLFASPQFGVFMARNWALVKRGIYFRKTTATFNFKKLTFFIVIFLVGLAIIHVLNKQLYDFHSFHLYFYWTSYSLVYIYLLIRFVYTKKSVEAEAYRPLSLPHWSFMILPIIVFLNGLSPYLGLKTENSYSMFSNLRTEGGKSNHYIIPVSFQIFDYQKDIVEVISSSDNELQEAADTNSLMVFFTFKDLVAQNKPAKVEYIRNGIHQTFELAKAPANSELLQPNNFILRQLLRFRLISKYDPQPCSH